MRLAAALSLSLMAAGVAADAFSYDAATGEMVAVVVVDSIRDDGVRPEGRPGNEARWNISDQFPVNFQPRPETGYTETFGVESEPVGPGYGFPPGAGYGANAMPLDGLLIDSHELGEGG